MPRSCSWVNDSSFGFLRFLATTSHPPKLGHSLGPVVDVELVVNALDVCIHRVQGHAQAVGYFFVQEALSKQVEDFALARGKDSVRRRRGRQLLEMPNNEARNLRAHGDATECNSRMASTTLPGGVFLSR